MSAPLTMAKALNEGLRKAMESDDKVVIMGEDVGKLGGVFRITDGLQKGFGEDRVIDTPLAEAGIIGTAVGLAIRGYRPVCEIQFDGFVFPGFDQIVNQVAKFHNRSAGLVRMPITIQPKRLYHGAKADIAAQPTPLDQARIVRPGQHVTVVGYAGTVATLLESAAAAAEDGIELEVIDLRSVSPLDMATVLESVQRTGRLIVVHEAPRSFGVGAELAARVTEAAFYSLEAPVLRVTGYDTQYPPSRLEHEWLPNLDRVLDAVDKIMEY